MVLAMGIYKESYRLSKKFPGFPALKEKLDIATGLDNELEILGEKSVVFFNEKLKTTIEVSIESDVLISLYFPIRRKKNYIEWSLLNALNEYLTTPIKDLPVHVKKRWQDLNIIEKYFK